MTEKKTLIEVVRKYREREKTALLEYSGSELFNELEKLRNESWIQVEGLVAELQDDKHKTLPTHKEIQEMIGDPLGMKINSVFLGGFQSGWFNHAEKVLELLGAEQK